MSTIITILLTVLIFGVLIFIHELGHYLVARSFGVGIREFAIGMGPRLFSWQGKRNRFSLRAFPIGGFVDMVGELSSDEEIAPEDEGKTPFNSKPLWQRFLVVIAGPTMNILFGLIVMSLVVIFTQNLGSVEISSFNEDSFSSRNLVYFSEKSGEFEENDIIFSINGEKVSAENGLDAFAGIYEGQTLEEVIIVRKNSNDIGENFEFKNVSLPISSLSVSGALREEDKILEVDGSKIRVYIDMSYAIMNKGVEPIDISVLREGETVLIENVIFPKTSNKGVLLGESDFRVYAEEKTVKNVLYNAVFQSVSTLRITVDSVVDTFRGRYGIEALSGPVGIGSTVGEATKSSTPFLSVFSLVVMISLSLGVCNLLPLPVLDGGRLLLFIIEAIRRKPLSQKVEQALMAVSMTLVLLLMAVIMLKDIWALF